MRYPEPISRIIPRVLKKMNIETKLKNWRIVDKWKDIVGKRIAQHSSATSIDDENLWVEVDNPIWQSQLFIMKGMLIGKIKKFGIEIKDIKFRLKERL